MRTLLLLVFLLLMSACGEVPTSLVAPTQQLTAALPSIPHPPVPTVTPLPRPTQQTAMQTAPVLTPIGIASHFQITTYQGTVLPTLPASTPTFPPPVWLVINHQLIQGTLSSHGTADFAPPQYYSNIATATLGAGTSPSIVIGGGPILSFSTVTFPWTDDTTPATRLVSHPDPQNATAFLLDPPKDLHDQALLVRVVFDQVGNNANYVWHLNPTTK